jgi:hypothetical protein
MFNAAKVLPAGPGEPHDVFPLRERLRFRDNLGLGLREVRRRPVFAALSRGPWLVFMTIACFWQSNAEAWPSQETIANFSGYSSRAVRDFVAILERLGIVRLRRERRPSGADRIYYAPGLVTLVELAAFVERFPQGPVKATYSHLPEASSAAPPEASSMEPDPEVFKEPPLSPTPLPEPPALLPEPAPEAREAEIFGTVSEPEIVAIAHAWDEIGFGTVRARERQALRNRAAEGCSAEELAAAVKGAAADEWLRTRSVRGSSKSQGGCNPFAVVFHDGASVGRFAHEGRRRQAQAPGVSPPREPTRAAGPAASVRFHPRPERVESNTLAPPGLFAVVDQLCQGLKERRPSTREERDEWHRKRQNDELCNLERRRHEQLARAADLAKEWGG